MYTYKCELVRVIDGDTVVLDVDLGFDITTRKTVRLLDVDAPETRTKDLDEKEHGFEVKAEVMRCLDAAITITLESKSRGKYGRWLGVIYANDINLNEMVKLWSIR